MLFPTCPLRYKTMVFVVVISSNYIYSHQIYLDRNMSYPTSHSSKHAFWRDFTPPAPFVCILISYQPRLFPNSKINYWCIVCGFLIGIASSMLMEMLHSMSIGTIDFNVDHFTETLNMTRVTEDNMRADVTNYVVYCTRICILRVVNEVFYNDYNRHNTDLDV